MAAFVALCDRYTDCHNWICSLHDEVTWYASHHHDPCTLAVPLLAGLVHVINKFRMKTLGLAPVRLGNKGPHLLAAHEVNMFHPLLLMISAKTKATRDASEQPESFIALLLPAVTGCNSTLCERSHLCEYGCILTLLNSLHPSPPPPPSCSRHHHPLPILIAPQPRPDA